MKAEEIVSSPLLTVDAKAAIGEAMDGIVA